MSQEAIFFENDAGHAAAVAGCAGIKVVKVSSGAPTENPAPADNFYRQYLAKVEALTRAHTPVKENANRWLTAHKLQYYTGSGIGPEHYIIYDEWRKTGDRKYLILDWDRTLTQVEGILIPQEEKLNNSEGIYSLEEKLALICSVSVPGSAPLRLPPDTLEQIVLYLCGGPARVRFIRELAADAVEAGLKIIILTNNPVAFLKPTYFETVVRQLLGQEFRVICSARGTAAGGNKRRALELDPKLGALCGLVATMPRPGPSPYNLAAYYKTGIPANNGNNGNNSNNYLVATTPGPRKRGGGTRRKYKRRTIKLRRFMRRLRATRHRRNGSRKHLCNT
jgi:hypothetical protein